MLLSDTVGFIRNLPHTLVASFKATLEEARQADLLLHVVDASSPEAEPQIQAVKEVLAELGLADHPTILVLNKADRVPDRSFLDVLRAHHRDSVTISAARADGLDHLQQAVREALHERALDAEVETGVGNGRVLAYLAQHAQIQQRTYDADRVLLLCRLPRRCLDFLCENGARSAQVASVCRPEMSNFTKIEWTDHTWNPIRGCTKISPGCVHCYAETFAERFRGVPGHPYEQGFDLLAVPAKLAEPFRWSSSRMVFVNSMSDLFHRDVAPQYIELVAQVMEQANWHTYQVLTKRSERMRDMLQGPLAFASRLPHIWWGVSVEDRAHGLPRVDHLRSAPAGLRMLSVEPLLEDLGRLDLTGIGWVIAGGESGPGARAMDPAWVASVRDQCRAAGVPFFFKQWGGTRKGRAGRTLDGRTHDDVPPRTNAAVPPAEQRRARIDALTARIAALPPILKSGLENSSQSHPA